jgi:hypothetical protein
MPPWPSRRTASGPKRERVVAAAGASSQNRRMKGRVHPRHERRRVAIALAAVLLPIAAGAEIHRCPRADGTMEFRDRPCGAGPAETAPTAPAAPAPVRKPRGPASAGAGPAPGVIEGDGAAAQGARGTAGAARSGAGAPLATFVSPTFPTNGGPATADSAATADAPRTSASTTRRESRDARPFVSPLPPSPLQSSTAQPPPPANRAAYVARNEALCHDGDRRACAAVTCDRSGDLASPDCQKAVGYVRGRGWDLRPSGDLFDPNRQRDDYTLTCRATGRRAALSQARGSDSFDWPGGPSPAVARGALAAAARDFCSGP